MSIAGSSLIILSYVQIVLSALLIGGILLQPSEAGMGGIGGGDSFSSGHHTKRGSEKIIFIGTIVVAILFAVVSFSLILI